MDGLKEAINKVNEAVEKSAKLSTKQRKKLKESQFCGPGRSYPVNDCAHYTAALRLLNRGKFSEATKTKIKSCIMRKGKSLGCTKKENSEDIESLINSEIFKSTRDLVEKSLESKDPIDLCFDDCEMCG